MAKRRIAQLGVVKNLLYPHLPVLVGANVNGEPNYLAIGLIGWLCYDAISVSVGHKQYSNPGIRENGTFSINQPTAGMVRELDYCGIYSGRKVDKSQLFDNFYGKLKTAPMIRQCPVNIECRVFQVMERRIHTVFMGEVVSVYVDSKCTTGGIPDMSKINPILYVPFIESKKEIGKYYTLGEYLGQAWQIGRGLESN